MNFLTFEIWIFKKNSNGDRWPNRSLCRPQKIIKLCGWQFFIWNHISMKNYVWVYHIWNSNSSRYLGWRNNQNQSCRSPKVIKLYIWQLFHLNSLRVQILILNSNKDKIRRTNILNGHNRLMAGLVRGGAHKCCVACLSPNSCALCIFHAKKLVTCHVFCYFWKTIYRDISFFICPYIWPHLQNNF